MEIRMKNPVLTLIVSLAMLICSAANVFAELQADTPLPEKQDMFFEQLKSLCGARYEGESVFPEDPGDDWRDQLLVVVIETCNADEIRIPLAVGQDHSRTWVLKKTNDGLQLKHDHRHEDGTPDEVTLYGGTATSAGTGTAQSFPADAYTADLIPDAATNEWFLSLSDDNNKMTYYLERHNKPRFKAVLYRVP
jgi:hypothetical protein